MLIVPRSKWRLGLSALATMGILSVLILTATVFGVGEPPRAAHLYREFSGQQVTTGTNTQPLDDRPHLWRFIPDSPDFVVSISPLTIEMQAANLGADDSAWGLYISMLPEGWTFLVRDDGYVSVAEAQMYDWREFIHIRDDVNELYLHFNEIGNAQFRVNGEIAWSGRLPVDEDFFGASIAFVRNPQLRVDYLRVYVGENPSP